MGRLLPLALLVLVLAACGGEEPAAEPAPAQPAETESLESRAPSDTETERAETAPATTEAPPPSRPLPGLPPWTAGYGEWTRLNAQPLPPRDPDPHLGTKNVFANRPAEGGVYPIGTVIVKEAFRPGADFVGLIATMRKVKDADPVHNDWVFVEWAREAENDSFEVIASGSVCTSCHAGVADQDYVFTRP